MKSGFTKDILLWETWNWLFLYFVGSEDINACFDYEQVL